MAVPSSGRVGTVYDSGVLVDSLAEVVGPHVIVDPDRIASYTTDWTGRFVGHAAAVVRPASTDEVAGVIAVCRRHRVALVPQGGNTGLVGGGVPLHDEVVLSLGRLNRLGPVDPVAGQVTAEAGVVLSAVQEVGRSTGWAYGVDLASRGSATVGGTVATNAGGRASSATATPGPSSSGWRPCWATAPSSPTSAGWSRTTPGTTCPA